MNPIELILARHFPDQQWRITRPETGLQKEAYIVHGERHKLFLKFDAGSPAWERLADLGVAPPLLGRGTYEGRSYLIQAFVEGTHPDRGWFSRHLAELARFFRRVHADRPLNAILARTPPQSHAEHVRQEVISLEKALAAAASTLFSTDPFPHTWKLFGEQARQLRPVPLVPVHPDPSPRNMFVTKHGLIMVDWDDVMLSDPLRDLGLVAWWYLPQNKWPAFFALCGAPIDRDRIFWWVARRSLEVALWFDAHHANRPARSFLNDFYRAVQHQGNPQVAS